VKQRLNYTNRKRITLDLIAFRVVERDGEIRLFTEKFDLAGLGLPADAEVFLILRQPGVFEVERVNCGRVGELRPPSGLVLDCFATAAGLAIKAEVVAVDDEKRGMILAHAPKVQPVIDAPGQADLDRVPLLPFIPSDDLGDRLWMLQLDGLGEPAVLINKGIGSWRALVRSDSFQLLVFPEVAHQVARWYLLSADEDVHENGVLAQWNTFFENLEPGVRSDRPDDEDALHEWADDRSRQLAALLGQRIDVLQRGMSLVHGEDE
jgi:hypothetical protein